MKEITNIEDVHGVLFDALCYLDDFCKANGIRYYISNGTLLGAAKYGNFIPWDDDVDIMIPREDYDKLARLTAINNEKYKLMCKEQLSEWRMPYAKLSCENTIAKEGEYDFGVPVGLSVDIFPIDNWSNCLLVAKLQAFNSECLKRLLICSIGGDFITQKKGLKRFILKIIWCVGKKIGHKRIGDAIINTIKKSNCKKSKYVGCRSWTSHLDGEILPASFFVEATYLDFCGRKFPVISEFESYLSRLYGDWRREVPSDEQHSNHDMKAWWKDGQ